MTVKKCPHTIFISGDRNVFPPDSFYNLIFYSPGIIMNFDLNMLYRHSVSVKYSERPTSYACGHFLS